MTSSLLVEVLGTMRQGQFTPARPRMARRLAEPTLIGSRPGPGATLVLEHPSVSKRHAEVFFRDGAWHIRDLHSDNGLILLRKAPDVMDSDPGEPAGEHVQETAITPALIVAVGAVVVRLTTASAEDLTVRAS